MITGEALSKIIDLFNIQPHKGSKILVGMQLKQIRKFAVDNINMILSIPEVSEVYYTQRLTNDKLSLEVEKVLLKWNASSDIGLNVADLPQDTEEQKGMVKLRPFLNAKTGDVELMNTVTGGIADIHVKSWCHTFNIPLKESLELCESLFPQYRPDIEEKVFMHDGGGVSYKVLNTYIKPKWERDDLGQPKMPEIFRKFFFHLFPTDESRLAAYHHLYYMLTERSQVLLCLAGRQAIGKSIFAETIIKAMIGKSNWQKAPRSFTKKEFNGFLKNRRVVVVEEIPLAANREERTATNEMIKDILNDTVTIEEKGVDAFTIDNHVTVFVTTNTPKAIPLVDMNDRRFLCLDVTKNQLRKSMSDAEIIKLKNMTDSSPEIADLCRWILANGKIEGKDAFYNFTNDLKRKIYFLTLSSWELGILEWIDINKNEYTQGIPMEHIVKEAKKHNMGKAVKPSTVEEFLNKHQMMGGGFIGDVSNSRLYLTEDAMNNPVSDSIKGLERELFGIDEDDEDFLTKMEKESSL